MNALGGKGNTESKASDTEEKQSLQNHHIQILPFMQILWDTKREWLSDEELWPAIPERGTEMQCLTQSPRKSWKLMVEFFMALNSNMGSRIRNLERRDMMLLASLPENLFGFAGTHAKKQKASLALLQTGWKR